LGSIRNTSRKRTRKELPVSSGARHAEIVKAERFQGKTGVRIQRVKRTLISTIRRHQKPDLNERCSAPVATTHRTDLMREIVNGARGGR
jgi:hypothetical protein